MTIEVRQLLIRSRVGEDDPAGTDDAPIEPPSDETLSKALSAAVREEMDKWWRHLADAPRSPRER